MWTIRQAGCGLEAWCEIVDYQLIMWHFLLVWIFAHFRLGELLITKSKRLVKLFELCWHHSGWLKNGRMQHFLTRRDFVWGDKVVLWHGIEVTDSTSKLNQSGDKLLPMWLSLGIRFQNPSVSGFVLPIYLVGLAWSGNKTSVLKLPTHLPTNKPIFLPTNPSFYQKKTSFYQQIQ